MQSDEQGEVDDQTDDRFPVSLRGSWFGLNRKFRLRLSDHPLTPAQYTTLRNICEFQNGVLNQKKLSELVSSNENNLVAILRKLERCKLIERKKVKSDLRSKTIVATELGKKYFHSAREIAHQLQDEVMMQFSSDEAGRLLGYLEKCSDQLDQLPD